MLQVLGMMLTRQSSVPTRRHEADGLVAAHERAFHAGGVLGANGTTAISTVMMCPIADRRGDILLQKTQ
jgi:hypothetical protein